MRSDTEIAREYARTGSEEAFAEIARRHGATVYRSCLRILGDRHAAEDASQAVFLVLVDRRRSLRRVRSLGAWLHGVARRIALMSRRTASRRTRHEEEAGMLRNCDGPRTGPDRQAVSEVLDGELCRLPVRQREAVVLRYLEDRSVEESAMIAGCPAGTLGRRASDGLANLRRRLAPRGAALSAAALGALLAEEAATAVPGTLMPSLLAVTGFAVGMGSGGQAAGRATLLAKGAVKAMFWTKVKIATAVLCAAAAVGVGSPVAYRALAAASAESGNGKKAAPKDTALGRLAASLKPGEIQELKTRGYNREFLKSWYSWDHDAKGTRIYGAQKMGNIMTSGWANDAKWDPNTGRILYFGGAHYASFKFVTYSADANEWKLMPVPVWCDPRIAKTSEEHGWCGNGWIKNKKTGEKRKCWPRGHSYDCQAVWPEKRIYAAAMWSWLRLYDLDKNEWMPSAPGFRTNSGGPCEAFPELGGFVAFSRPNQLCLFDPAKRTKRDLGRIGFGIHGIMEYNPVHKVVIVGGGDARGDKPVRNLYLIDRRGKVTKLKPMPDWLRCTPDAKVMCDPASGEYVVQGHRPRKGGEDLGKVHAFHPLKDEWKEIPKLRFPGGVAVPVSTYGVIVICTGGKVLVYKHKPVWPAANGK
jgi:RNA polymerase sigma factor (sigma-70 family)